MALKTHLIKRYTQHPWQVRLFLLVVSLIAGFLKNAWGDVLDSEFAKPELILNYVLSIILWFVMFTLYRMVQRIFKKRIKTDDGALAFDERRLFEMVALFGVIPFGGIIYLLRYLGGESTGYAEIMMVQGLAIYSGIWLSRRVKK